MPPKVRKVVEHHERKGHKDHKDKEFKEPKEFKDSDVKWAKDKDFKDVKEFKDSDAKWMKDKDHKDKEIKESDKVFAEDFPLNPGTPIERDILAQLQQRVANLEAIIARGQSFIQPQERPPVGKLAAKKRRAR